MIVEPRTKRERRRSRHALSGLAILGRRLEGRHALFVDAVFGFGPRASGPLREKVIWIAPRWLSQAEDQVLQGGTLGRDPNRNCPASAAGPSHVHVGY